MPKTIDELVGDEEIDQTTEINYDDYKKIECFYNDVIEDYYKWYLGAIKDGIGNVNALYKSLLWNIKVLIRRIRRVHGTLEDYPELTVILNKLLNN
jgi:hypothetical protein